MLDVAEKDIKNLLTGSTFNFHNLDMIVIHVSKGSIKRDLDNYCVTTNVIARIVEADVSYRHLLAFHLK